ncbi:MAG TPA: hypothetical protein VFQ68_45625 [Streptosporangiaceae bacterium]|nr:hypothetical protein [Streptosporangiaceae bacterium]
MSQGTVEGRTIAALTAGPAAGNDSQPKPLIAALHGGTYTARYYDVAGSAQGSFMDLAAAAGYPVLCFDRPDTARARRSPRRTTPSPATPACCPTPSRRLPSASEPTACS